MSSSDDGMPQVQEYHENNLGGVGFYNDSVNPVQIDHHISQYIGVPQPQNYAGMPTNDFRIAGEAPQNYQTRNGQPIYNNYQEMEMPEQSF